MNSSTMLPAEREIFEIPRRLTLLQQFNLNESQRNTIAFYFQKDMARLNAELEEQKRAQPALPDEE